MERHVSPRADADAARPDPHSPPEYRVNGVVPNIPAFYEAFKIQPGDKLYLDPAKRVKIW